MIFQSFGAEPEAVCYEATFRFVSPFRLLYLVFGIALFQHARKLAKMLAFHYMSGVGLGLGLAMISN